VSAKLREIRHFWPSIARDLVQLTLPQHHLDPKRAVVVTYYDIMRQYGLSVDEMQALADNPTFQALVKAEKTKAASLGTQASQVFRAEAMATRLAEELFARLIDESGDACIADLLKGYEIFAKSAGLTGGGHGAAENKPTVAIQINIPELAGDKLAHLRKRIDA
jgi:hypothetical protein